LKNLKKAVAASDKLATAELIIAKDQLQSLHGTVMKINQERAEVSSHDQNKFPPVLLLPENTATCIVGLLLLQSCLFFLKPEDYISPITSP
jgi:centriolin